jgi:hypothetical protein
MTKPLDIDLSTLLQIDRFVAKLEGFYQIRSHGDFTIHIAEDNRVYFLTQSGRAFPFAPTVDWRQCGPIIENNHISIETLAIGWRRSPCRGCSRDWPARCRSLNTTH